VGKLKILTEKQMGIYSMSNKEQIQDMIESLSSLDTQRMTEDNKDEAAYLINDIIISLEELIDIC
jgi:hypothetical protein